jgi:hypothetical protein
VDESLVSVIHAAFPAGMPPARPVTGHRCVECDDIDQHVGGRAWPDVAADILPVFSDVFPLLTPAAQAH